MAVVIVGSEMLYCPKCGSTYEDGSQRFCTNDGGRLLTSAPSLASANKSNPANNSKGVFTNLLGRTASSRENDEKLSQSPKFTPIQHKESEKTGFQTNFSSKVFLSETAPVKREEKPINTPKPVVRLIKPSEPDA